MKLMISPTFYYSVLTSKHFGNHGLKWWFSVTKTEIRHVDHLQENILFGFDGSNGIIDVLNYCILYAKYYIYKDYLIKTNLMSLLT